VARAAARQSRRPHIPPVSGVVGTDELVTDVRTAVSSGTTVLALHESTAELLTEVSLAQTHSLMLLVGPEGGITDEEIAALSDAGARVVRLGPTVLRTSTAAAVALGALGALTPRWT
jgi:16S rRNA (uracil1498-N3)-methyltransferase